MKKWYHSKTIWLNTVAAFFAVLPEILSAVDVNFLTAIGVTNTTKSLSIIGLITTILNIFLRVQSAHPSAPIKTKKRTKKQSNESN